MWRVWQDFRARLIDVGVRTGAGGYWDGETHCIETG